VNAKGLKAIGHRLEVARGNLARVIAEAQEAAEQAVADGMTEVEVARMLGVDRSRTLRRWLGK
jgi:hypothetical protein